MRLFPRIFSLSCRCCSPDPQQSRSARALAHHRCAYLRGPKKKCDSPENPGLGYPARMTVPRPLRSRGSGRDGSARIARPNHRSPRAARASRGKSGSTALFLRSLAPWTLFLRPSFHPLFCPCFALAPHIRTQSKRVPPEVHASCKRHYMGREEQRAAS